jgi:uncharacterized protein (TIRG00374 family)
MANHTPRLAVRPAGQRIVINSVVFIAVVFVLGSQLGNLSASVSSLRYAHAGFIILATVSVSASILVAAASYQLLAGSNNLRFFPTLAVQIASGVANRLLPSGLGSLGLFTAYYRKHGLSLAAATALATTNNILGVCGNILLIVTVLLVYPSYATHVRLPHIPHTTLLAMFCVIVVAICIGLGLLTKRMSRIMAFIRAGFSALRLSLRPNRKTMLAFVSNILLTSLNALTLSLAVRAIGGGADLSWPAALLVLSLGTFVGAAVPTPGGIGGVEAGLLAGMVAFGVASSAGLAAVLVYRVLTYWLPIIPGLLMFRRVEKRYV